MHYWWDREEKENVKHPVGYKLMTSLSLGVCSTSELQSLLKNQLVCTSENSFHCKHFLFSFLIPDFFVSVAGRLRIDVSSKFSITRFSGFFLEPQFLQFFFSETWHLTPDSHLLPLQSLFTEKQFLNGIRKNWIWLEALSFMVFMTYFWAYIY